MSQFQSAFGRKRQEMTLSIRAQNRQQILMKRRNVNNDETNEINGVNSTNNPTGNGTFSGGLFVQFDSGKNASHQHHIVDERFANEIAQYVVEVYPIERINDYILEVQNGNIIEQHHGLIGIRKLLSKTNNSPIQKVIDSGLVPKLMEYASQSDYLQLKLEAAWTLANIASGNSVQVQSIVDKGIIQLSIELAQHTNHAIVEQAVWIIGNIASDSSIHRDSILRKFGLKIICSLFSNTGISATLIRTACWVLSNLCRGNPLPSYTTISAALPIMCRAVASGMIEDPETLTDCCWAISYHSSISGDSRGVSKQQMQKLQDIISSGLVDKVVGLLANNSDNFVLPCLRIIGNVSLGPTEYTDRLIELNIIQILGKFLDNGRKSIKKEASWVLSNIASGTQAQALKVFQHSHIIQKLLQLFATDAPYVRRQICYVFSGLITRCDPQTMIHFILDRSLLLNYTAMFNQEDARLIIISLTCLYAILSVGERFKTDGLNPLVADLHRHNGVRKLEGLQRHTSKEVYQQTCRVIEAYFDIKDPFDM